MKTIIKVENLSKQYNIQHQTSGRYQYNTLRDALANSGKQVLSFFKHPLASSQDEIQDEEFWALKDINFEIKEGERVGIIGRNGAGKSTLLKILSRITQPTTGEITIRGRITSLLEVGTGFHPELTGRENIFLNGAILGMRKWEIQKKFDEIVAFAEVEKFLDTPVKRYSSGMYVRLAFAVAAHLEPEILIVDEVLAVGDAQFQKKCLGKMNEAGKDGRTILFVSHNMVALKSLCDKAIWINSGRIIESGYTENVVSNYLQHGKLINLFQLWEDPKTAPGNSKARLHKVKIFPRDEIDKEAISVATAIDIEVEFWNFESGALLNLSLVLYDNQDICIFNTGSNAKVFQEGKVKGICHIPGNFLNDGIYRVRLLIVKDQSMALIDLDNVAMFEVQDIEREGAWYGKWVGAVRPNFKWDF